MTETWEYTRADLSLTSKRGSELDILNALGAEGWELVAIMSNNVAYLKRMSEEEKKPKNGNNRKKITAPEVK